MAQQLTLTIVRDSLGSRWGFKLVGGSDCGTPLHVERVTAGSAADTALKRGDVIIAVNGEDVRRSTHFDALDLIASAGSSLNFVVLRQAAPAPQRAGPPRAGAHFRSSVQRPAQLAWGGARSPQMASTPTSAPHFATLPRTERASSVGRYGRVFSNLSSPEAVAAHEDKDITLYLPKPPRYFRSQSVLSPVTSGRSSPASVLELKSPDTRGPPAVAVWTPPNTMPNSRLVHLQYNSPLSMYSVGNVADTIQRSTGRPLQWQQPPRQTYSSIKESPTKKLIDELEGRREETRRHGFTQSSIFDRIASD